MIPNKVETVAVRRLRNVMLSKLFWIFLFFEVLVNFTH